jgi:hypothetical protein
MFECNIAVELTRKRIQILLQNLNMLIIES